jgi:hypothetical protein
MAAMSSTSVDTIVGVLSNGKKLVQTTVTCIHDDTGAAKITVAPLKSIEQFAVFPKNPGTAPTTFIIQPPAASTSGTNNTLLITPAADADGAVIEIISVGV